MLTILVISLLLYVIYAKPTWLLGKAQLTLGDLLVEVGRKDVDNAESYICDMCSKVEIYIGELAFEVEFVEQEEEEEKENPVCDCCKALFPDDEELQKSWWYASDYDHRAYLVCSSTCLKEVICDL